MQTRQHRKFRYQRNLWATSLMFFCLHGHADEVSKDETGCNPKMAKLISAQGDVEDFNPANQSWLQTHENQTYCGGNKVRTGDLSRAVLLIEQDFATYLTMDQLTQLSFHKADDHVLLSVDEGQTHIRSHTPKQFDVNTPFVNAGIEGTEFLVTSDKKHSEVTVLEGKVRVYNAQGQVTIISGQTASAEAGKSPVLKQLINPDNAIKWALYYPPVIDAPSLLKSTDNANVHQALSAYQAGQFLPALTLIKPIAEQLNNAEAVTVYAGLLLTVGQVEQAQPLITKALQHFPNNSSLQALRAIIALTENDHPQADEWSQRAVAQDSNNPTAYIARSYIEQSQFRLEQALASINEALNKTKLPNALLYSRQAELLASLGKLEAANQAASQAVALNPRLARPLTVLGFTQLMTGHSKEAQNQFNNAITRDSSDPLAYFGLALLQIKQDNLAEGKKFLELATSIDPNDSLLRSYLGKVYYELHQNKISRLQLDLAKKDDPRDPTPYLYSAIENQATNRPAEAIKDIEKSVALNNNRAVSRSRQLLDSDRAARGAALGRVYNQAGFTSRALVHAWTALADDPSDFSAHRLLSDTLAKQPNSDAARTSELLQSQLLQPLNSTPVQPLLAENSQFLNGNLGPSSLSMNEFNPVFDRNRNLTLASGLVGGNDTYGDELVHSGLHNNWSYSLGQYHYQTSGYRANNYINADLYNAFVQNQVSSTFSVQAEYKHKNISAGYLDSTFFPLDSVSQQLFDHRNRQNNKDNYRLGFHWQPDQQSHLLGSYIHFDQTAPTAYSAFNLLIPPPPTSIPIPSLYNQFALHGNQAEMQYQRNFSGLQTLLGSSLAEVHANSSGNTGITNNETQLNSYLYNYYSFPANIKWTIGVSYTGLRDVGPAVNSTNTVNPKFGMAWQLTPQTVLRAAYLQNTKNFAFADQSLEPTQLAGFNQLFDDPILSRSTRYGVGIDQDVNHAIKMGAELSQRDINTSNYIHPWQETRYRAYLLTILNPRWLANLEFFRERYTDNQNLETETQYIPLTISYYDPSGWYIQNKNTQYFQSVVQRNQTALQSGEDSREFIDLTLGYRLPKRQGIVELGLQNLLNQHYQYQSYLLRNSSIDNRYASQMPFPEGFMVSARMTLAF